MNITGYAKKTDKNNKYCLSIQLYDCVTGLSFWFGIRHIVIHMIHDTHSGKGRTKCKLVEVSLGVQNEKRR